MQLKIKIAVLSLVTAALLLAGCGSDSAKIKRNNDYVRQINAAQQTFATAASTISSLITPTSLPASDAASLQKLGTTLDGTVAAFQAANPPSGLGSLHQQLIDELHRYAAAVHAAGAKVGSETALQETVTLRKLVADIQTIDAQFNATVDAINKKLKSG
jgi:outer membrane murein-binding lipoprotein Lpp